MMHILLDKATGGGGLLFAGIPFDGVVFAQRGTTRRCNPQFPVCMDANILDICHALPTSLPVVDPSGPLSGPGGFRASGSGCGAKTCYYLFSCVCGYPLGTEFCAGERSECGMVSEGAEE